jgi:hypothetical protein
MKLQKLVTLTAAALLALALGACSSGDDEDEELVFEDLSLPLPGDARAYLLVTTLAGEHRIARIANSGAASVVATEQTIDGLPDNEQIIGMDFRPATGDLYLVGRRGLADNAIGAVYRIAAPIPDSGPLAALLVGELSAMPGDSEPFTGFDVRSDGFGVDFNPVADALRIVGPRGENYRIPFAAPATGTAVITDTRLSFEGDLEEGIGAAAYSSSDTDPATATELYVINPERGRMFRQSPPNDGILVERRRVTDDSDNLEAAGGLGFDILTVGGVDTAFVAGQDRTSFSDAGIGTLDLASGAFTLLFSNHEFNRRNRIRGLAMAAAAP